LFNYFDNKSMDDSKISHLWGHLHWLVVLAEQESYTGAAKRLGVSKAAVSHRVSELERIAGIALVTRTTRSVRLTEAGLKLVAQSQPAFDALQQSFNQVRESAGILHGVIRVTAPAALARQQLLPHFVTFLKQHPQLRIELDSSDRMVSLAREGFDLAIRHTDSLPQTHVAVRLCPTRSVLVASPNYLAVHGIPRIPEDLQQHACLHYPRAGEVPIWHFKPKNSNERGMQQVVVQIQSALAANNSEVLRDAALLDSGIALIPDFTAQAAISRGELQEVLSQWEFAGGQFANHIYAVRPYALHAPLAVSSLLDFLRRVLSNGFPIRSN
jgi:DNA-binding transcriptional LysR family regulator